MRIFVGHDSTQPENTEVCVKSLERFGLTVELLDKRVLKETYGYDRGVEDGSAIASSSLLTEWVKGRHIDSAELIKNTQIAEELALPPVKIHCSVLAEDAIKAAVKDLRSKRAEFKS